MPFALVLSGLWCLLLATWLVRQALESARQVDGWFRGTTLRGVLTPESKAVLSPFSERPALFVRVRLVGPGPEGGVRRVLWEKTLSAKARIEGVEGAPVLDLSTVLVEAPNEYRYGVVRVLARASRVVPRALSKAGYEKPPPPDRMFELEEELLAPGDEVVVRGGVVRDGVLLPLEGATLRVSNLSRTALALRVAWGPLLSLWCGLFVFAAGLVVLGSTYWLHR